MVSEKGQNSRVRSIKLLELGMTLAQVAVWLLAVGPGVSFAPTGQAKRSVSHLRAERDGDVAARARAPAAARHSVLSRVTPR